MTGAELPRALIVMGVAGAGKSAVGRVLAARLGWAFVEGDELHPEDNVAKMRRGQPLTDEDRAPWLNAIAARIGATLEAGQCAVVTCSALKARYRRQLMDEDPRIGLVHLRITPEAARTRLATRSDHFMPANLADSQFAALEPPEEAIEVDATQPLQRVVEQIATEKHEGAKAGRQEGGEQSSRSD